MTEKREFYAASVEEAVARAAKDLGREQDELSYRVVDQGNSGFLGIGARDARIEVDAPPAAITEEPAVPETFSERPVAEEVTDDEDATEEESRSAAADIAPEPQEDAEDIPEEIVVEAEGRITALLDAMGFDARVEVYDAGGFVAVDVATEDTALFIGQKGETIDALQYLVNASINRTKTSRVRVVLDAEGYRQRRVEALQGMAHRSARKALREDRPVELPPMNPAERRVVHLFLRDNPRVMTESEGVGDSRRVRVSPA
ncbi:MAG: protein jag [Rubrobacter sp.]|jgi:spoIIIJ-associated protein|nr:protein jag [Rubrobacter sp.]MDQ3362999.1 protein jag [Actinomycetota bacterium]